MPSSAAPTGSLLLKEGLVFLVQLLLLLLGGLIPHFRQSRWRIRTSMGGLIHLQGLGLATCWRLAHTKS